eukprot:gene7048-8196_t
MIRTEESGAAELTRRNKKGSGSSDAVPSLTVPSANIATGPLKDDGDMPHSPSLERFSAISKPRESLLTSPPSANIQWGTFNYIALCYVGAGIAMMSEAYETKGVFVDFSLLWFLIDRWYIGLFLWAGLVVFSYVNFLCTKLFVDGKLNQVVSILLYCTWQVIAFYVSISYIMHYDLSPILSGGCGMQLCVYSLKNHSYWHTNYFLKKGVVKATAKNSPITRRDLIPNVSIKHFSYFLVAPTLVFENHFPMTPSIRITYLLKETSAFIGTFFVFYLMLCKSNTYYVKATKIPLWILVTQLSLPAMSLWMLGFYGVFHCLLNIFAELTRYADREFYQDWWNATTFDMWWRRWNRPVHKWMLRHVYTDSMHTIKLNKFGAFLSTFLLSALLHEIVMIIAFRFVSALLIWMKLTHRADFDTSIQNT